MQYVKGFFLLLIFTLLLTGCTGVANEKSPSKTKLTIEPYSLNEKESVLIRKTGVEIEFFKLNGTLKEEDDLQFSVEVYENGKFKEELLKTSGAIETNYKDSVISFGISDIRNEEQSIKLLSGIHSGLASTFYSSNMTGYAFGKLVGDKVTLEKDKPMYIAGWLGTTKNSLRSVGEQNGELPQAVEDYELAFLYKVLWTDKEQK